ncbi:TraK domain-containing protein [Thiocapsa marina]|uniref:IncF plasmid conjugative transfer pilus assembly protein TraK n=1 Tax=Thiocapsa marina 5811 TaxID=768671 RepID=F9UAG2_9GAMM|nr:type-F conjugative transfer system secretin TraK [Thiocapsa marina]EGV19110.1 IncF plasmid conjugative transfer pilus assembly protein TraK [Thiocapsa marina 5811]
MITRRLSILAAVLAASSAQAEPAFEIPPVPCTLLDAGCTPSAVSSVLQTSRSEASPEGLIRTVMGGGATPARRTGGTLPVTLELGPRNLAVTPGTTVLIEIAIGHLNRIVTPFADPVVHTVSNASTQVDGSVVYVATDTEEPVALYIGDGQGSTLALALTLAPRYVPPREVRLTVPGYRSKRAGNPTATRAAVEPVAVMPMLANASDRDGDGNGPAYVSDLVEQLRALAQGRMPAGFRIAKGAGGTKLRCAEGLKVRSGERAEGPASDLLKARVVNIAAHSITLEHDTCRPDAATATVAAMAAWPRRVLAPGEETEVFLLLARDAPPHRTPGQPR